MPLESSLPCVGRELLSGTHPDPSKVHYGNAPSAQHRGMYASCTGKLQHRARHSVHFEHTELAPSETFSPQDQEKTWVWAKLFYLEYQ
jgi:hypothetical protein